MKRYSWYLMLLIACIFSSCRNYTKEFKQLAFELENKGTLIDKNEKLHMVLYEEDGCVKANDLDTCWIVFSPQNQLNTYKYQLDIDDKGMHVIAKIENINIKNDIISYGKNYLSFFKSIITDSNGKLSHFNLTIYPNDNTNIKWYEYDSRKPNLIIPELHTTSFEKEFGEKDNYNNDWNSISIDASFISDKLNTLFNSSEIEHENISGIFTVYFKTKNGEIEQISNTMKYVNEDYDMRYKVKPFKSIDDISNFYYNINIEKRMYEEKMKEIERKKYIESEKKNFIKFEKIANDFSNNSVKASEFYKGKILKVACKLYKIENNNNLFYWDYKYKLESAYYLFTEGFFIRAYTNDVNFVNLDYPSTVYMETTLSEMDGGTLIFSNCKLIMVE